ncbi:unnamed protein product [Bursaphelenchus xylophilus]|uniref:Sodium/potassium-transporting ATPase subunit alpha n=1 Tax=Bursaphelenchus xylophilus TaxID=6326 RepID=A0A7I8XLK8_BURXY|nr:unnamed protein product [Bursaphelenchus xylophilus]CAG9086737.1 unnamed protein product [Bursaphelenchus xylophilus]
MDDVTEVERSEDCLVIASSRKVWDQGAMSKTTVQATEREPERKIWDEIFCRKPKKKTGLSMADLKRDVEMDDHKIPLEEFAKRHKTNLEKGLTDDDAAERLKKDGLNRLTPPKAKSKLVMFLLILVTGFNILLWIGSIASLTSFLIEYYVQPQYNIENLYLAAVLFLVVVITSVFQFYQENKSSTIMKGFADMVPPMATVIRDGKHKEIQVQDLVVGDLVECKGGDRCPADIRIIKSQGFKLDYSSLTGENDPITKTPEFTHNNPLESRNVALFSTNVVEGYCKGIVMLTGDRTIMGRIAALTSQVTSGKTPLSTEMNHFINVIGIVAIVIGVVFFAISISINRNIVSAIIFFIGIVVANVPEGIVATITVALTLTAQKMSAKNCLVKNLHGVETLGSTSTICSDKTGTLTQNRMTVTHTWFDNNVNDVTDTVFPEPPTPNTTEGLIWRCATLCSRAEWRNEDINQPIKKREANGDASEIALLRYGALRSNDTVDKFRAAWPKVAEIPFNSSNKYQVSVHRNESDRFVLVMKGAPEKILARCTDVVMNNKTIKLGHDFKAMFTHAYDKLGGMGERVLGFCDLELDPEKFPEDFDFSTEPINFPLEGLRFLGLISMIDPPRPGVPEAVKLCQDARIKVVMVTGDHPITARAIAQQVHIINKDYKVAHLVEDSDSFDDVINAYEGEKAVIVHGEQLKKLAVEQLDHLVKIYPQVVFSRTSPTQKLQIVEAYQRCGRIVAVTGDGVNDAPALRKADIGIAMGIAGTEVSKQAADMILLNDNFASIITGVEEGRLIFDNLKKAVAYVLTSNVAELTPFLLYATTGIPLPLSIVAILLIDVGTDLWPAISLAYEEAENNIMKRPPRNPEHDKLVNYRLLSFTYLQIGVIQSLAGFTTYFIVMAENGFLPKRLYQIRDTWEDQGIDDVDDSYGQQWSYDQRKTLEHCCHGAFFFAIVVVQWADLIVARTRSASLLSHRFSNTVLLTGMLSTLVLSYLFLFVPGVHVVFQLTGLRIRWAMVAVPFGWFLVLFDETRRMAIRRNPTGWLYRETYY